MFAQLKRLTRAGPKVSGVWTLPQVFRRYLNLRSVAPPVPNGGARVPPWSRCRGRSGLPRVRGCRLGVQQLPGARPSPLWSWSRGGRRWCRAQLSPLRSVSRWARPLLRWRCPQKQSRLSSTMWRTEGARPGGVSRWQTSAGSMLLVSGGSATPKSRQKSTRTVGEHGGSRCESIGSMKEGRPRSLLPGPLLPLGAIRWLWVGPQHQRKVSPATSWTVDCHIGMVGLGGQHSGFLCTYPFGSTTILSWSLIDVSVKWYHFKGWCLEVVAQ